MVVKHVTLSLVLASSLATGSLRADNQPVMPQSESDFILVPYTTDQELNPTLQEETASVHPEKKPGDVDVNHVFFDDTIDGMDEFVFDLDDLRSAEAENPQTVPLKVQLKLAALYLNSCKDGVIEHVTKNREAYVYGTIACTALGIAFLIIKKRG